MGPHRAGDDIFWRGAGGLLTRHAACRFELPHERVVARELLDRAAAHAVSAAVADVPDERAAWHEHEHRAGGAHPAKLRGALPLGVDLGVGLLDAAAQGERRGVLGRFLIDEWHPFGRYAAGHLAGSVGPHAVGHEKHPAPRLILLRARRRQHRLRILVVRPPAADVGAVGVDQARTFAHASRASGGCSNTGF